MANSSYRAYYSIHDAIAAGFDKIVFIIRHDIEADFRVVIGDRIEGLCKPLGVKIAYAYQEITDVPDMPDVSDFSGKEKLIRQKPWGTGHAVLCAAEHIDFPFAVINADDYYGKNGFSIAARFISAHPENYALIG